MADSSLIDNLFEAMPVLDSRIRKYELQRFTTAQPFSEASNPSEIVIDTRSSSLDSLAILNQTFVDIYFRLRKSDNTDVTGAKAQIIQNGWSLFTRAQLLINDSEVATVDRPGMVSHVKHMVESTRDYVRGQGPASSYYPQDLEITPGVLDDTDNAVGADANVARAVRRYRAHTSDHHVRLYLRDVFGFAACNKPLLGARITVRLTPETVMTRIIKHSSALATQIRLKGCDMYLAVCRPDNQTLSELFSSVNSGKTIPYEYESYNYQSVVIVNGSTSETAVIPNSFKRPTAVYALMQLESDQGTLLGDKLVGRLFGLGSHRLQVDGKQYPEMGYEGATKGYIHEYETYLQCGGKHKDNVWGAFIDYDKWVNAYPLIAYDVSNSRDEFGAVRSNPPIIQWNATHANPGAAAVAHIIISGKEVRELNMINGVLMVSAPLFSD